MANGDFYPKSGETGSQEGYGDWMFFAHCGGSYVVEGLEITDNGGTDVQLAPGVAMINGKVIEITSAETLTVTDNATRYVGVSSTGVLEQQSSIDNRGYLRLPIAKVVTSGGSISSITYEIQRSTGQHGDAHIDRIADEVLIVKEADETVNSSTTVQGDDELSFNTGGGQKWQIRIALMVNSGATPDFKFRVTTNISGYFHCVGPSGTVGAVFEPYDTISVTTSGSDEAFIIEGVYYTGDNGSNLFRIDWAQNTSDAGDTTVKAGSYLHARRIKC